MWQGNVQGECVTGNCAGKFFRSNGTTVDLLTLIQFKIEMASPERQRDIEDCIKKLDASELFVKEYALRILINYAVDSSSYIFMGY